MAGRIRQKKKKFVVKFTGCAPHILFGMRLHDFTPTGWKTPRTNLLPFSTCFFFFLFFQVTTFIYRPVFIQIKRKRKESEQPNFFLVISSSLHLHEEKKEKISGRWHVIVNRLSTLVAAVCLRLYEVIANNPADLTQQPDARRLFHSTKKKKEFKIINRKKGIGNFSRDVTAKFRLTAGLLLLLLFSRPTTTTEGFFYFFLFLILLLSFLFWLSVKRKGWGEKNADEIEKKEATVCLHGGLENGHSRGQTHVHTHTHMILSRKKERKKEEGK